MPWGTVYDSITKQPLDPAYVTLIDQNGKKIASAITDLDGRYGFLTETGTYRIEANKTHYIFPSKKLAGRTQDELYANLYFGELFDVRSRNEAVIRNIPLDPINFDWNEFAKRDKKLMKYYSKYIFENEYMSIEGVKVLEPNFNPFKVRIKVAPEGEDPREFIKSKIVPEEDDLRQLLLEYKNSPQYRIDCLMFLKGELDAQMDRALHSEHK